VPRILTKPYKLATLAGITGRKLALLGSISSGSAWQSVQTDHKLCLVNKLYLEILRIQTFATPARCSTILPVGSAASSSHRNISNQALLG
jgi:hypothetical protein